ncbi:ComEC/Rec2 family competence protein [Robiginitalea marina]|uniref:ComEC family competence protein n=1 Tax=Robiginitalea marina TaxID=2954105 RepID=A0ABT1B1H0_9FLAO|nr:ComEC/Rec2 family competence protein [Robiginitalea marina]MCO5725705.1 ComEC family competence protein [Robiginitalea marina]
MPSHTTVSIGLAACLSAGVLSSLWVKPSFGAALLTLVIFLGLTGLGLRRMPAVGYWIPAGLAAWSLGLCSMAWRLPENRPLHFLHFETQPGGWVGAKVLEALRHTPYSDRYLAEITRVNGNPAEGKVVLQLPAGPDTIRLAPGQEIISAVFPGPVGPTANPGQFDYRAYLESVGIHGQLRLNEGEYLLPPPPVGGRGGRLATLRSRLLERLDEAGFSPAEAGVARALLLGDRSEMDPEVQAAYRKAGALHLLAVSGLHVGIVAGLVYLVLAPLGRGRYGKSARLFLTVALLWGYAFLAGLSPSVVRAVLLFSLVSYALYLQRDRMTLHFMGLGWMVMIGILDPLWLLQPGFQLSFAAVAAIVVYAPALMRWWPWKRRPWGWMGNLFCVSLAAQMGTLPLSLFYFHQFPGLFLLSGLALLPLMGLVLGMGFAVLLLQSVSLLPAFLPALYNAVLSGMNGFVRWVAGQEGFHLEGIPWDGVHLLLGGAALVLGGISLRQGSRWCLRGAVLALLLLQAYGIWLRDQDQEVRRLTIPHKVAASGFWVQEGRSLRVFSPDSAALQPLLRDAALHGRASRIIHMPLENHYRWGDQNVRVLDSMGVYSGREPSPRLLVLTGSPRVHLGRLLEALRPAQVVADGSNYHSYVRRWEQTCRLQGIPFHATAWSGAFVTELP